MKKNRALVYRLYGNPSEVLSLEESAAFEPCAGEVPEVDYLASNINPSDFWYGGGKHGALRDLPAVAGREGNW